jgi:ribose 5-phosphate isomerase B
MHDLATAVSFVETFLASDYSGEPRHGRRIAMLTAYETDGTLPELP